MSKRRRNHHIPRFLLNRFASRADRTTYWVWQISQNAALELSTRDVAVSRGFYGGHSAGVENALADAEGRFAAALDGMDAGQPADAFAEDLRQFTWTMAVRTRAIREQMATALEMLIGALSAWSNTPAAVEFLRVRFDEEVNKVIQKLPAQTRREAMTAIRAPARRGQLLNYAESNFGHWVGILIDLMQTEGLTRRSSKEGQVGALAHVLNSGGAPDSFKPAAWHLLACNDSQFVLGDGCVVARMNDGSLGSLIKSIKDWREIYVPISPHQVLAATREQTGPSLDNAAISRASAEFALQYIYASRTGPEIDFLRSVIGTGEPLMSQGQAAQIMTKAGTRTP